MIFGKIDDIKLFISLHFVAQRNLIQIVMLEEHWLSRSHLIARFTFAQHYLLTLIKPPRRAVK